MKESEFPSSVSDAIVKAKWLLPQLKELKEDHAKHHFLVTQVSFLLLLSKSNTHHSSGSYSASFYLSTFVPSSLFPEPSRSKKKMSKNTDPFENIAITLERF